MSEQTLNNPTTQDELADALAAAAFAGNDEEVNRLMAFELPEPTKAAEEEVEEIEPTEEVEEAVKDETSDEGIVEEKEEAAVDSAASKPDEQVEPKEEDELTKLRRELHEVKSQAGRVPYLNRRTQELERELREAKLNRKVAEATTPADSKDNVKTAIPEALQKKVEALRNIDPDTADILQDMLASMQAQQATAATAAKEMVSEFADAEAQKQHDAFLNEQFQTLVTRMPYAPKVFKSPEWAEWKNQLSPGRRALAESELADEVEIAINAFLHDMQARYGGAKQAPAVEDKTPVVDQQQAEAASKVQENRERKLKAEVETKGAVAKASKQQLDEDALFKSYYNQLRKEYHI